MIPQNTSNNYIHLNAKPLFLETIQLLVQALVVDDLVEIFTSFVAKGAWVFVFLHWKVQAVFFSGSTPSSSSSFSSTICLYFMGSNFC